MPRLSLKKKDTFAQQALVEFHKKKITVPVMDTLLPSVFFFRRGEREGEAPIPPPPKKNTAPPPVDLDWDELKRSLRPIF